MPNRQPTACSTSSPPGFCFLGRQLPKTGISPIRYVLPKKQQTDCKLIAHRSTTSADVYCNSFIPFGLCATSNITVLSTVREQILHGLTTLRGLSGSSEFTNSCYTSMNYKLIFKKLSAKTISCYVIMQKRLSLPTFFLFIYAPKIFGA